MNPPDLQRAADEAVRQIPPGAVAAAGDVARALGDVRAARWIGARRKAQAIDEPAWRRVVSAAGRLPDDPPELARLVRASLVADGLIVSGDRVAAFESVRFQGFACSAPLAALRRRQEELASRIPLAAPGDFEPRKIAGLDVSYRDDWATGAYVELGDRVAEPDWTGTHSVAATFPYISTYLAFRELAVFVPLLVRVESSRALADLLLVDGSGVLHPRRAGSACFVGAECDAPTIGVTKKLLCGRIDEERTERATGVRIAPVLLEGEPTGWAVWASSRSRRAVYLSPAWRMDVATIRRLVPRFFAGRRLPPAIAAADRLSRQAAQAATR